MGFRQYPFKIEAIRSTWLNGLIMVCVQKRQLPLEILHFNIFFKSAWYGLSNDAKFEIGTRWVDDIWQNPIVTNSMTDLNYEYTVLQFQESKR